MRIVPRRRWRRFRARFTRLNETKGTEWRESARQTSEDARARAGDELYELKTDARTRYERAKPRIEETARQAREKAERAGRFTLRTIKITLSIIASTVLVAGIVAVIYFLTRGSGTEESPAALTTLRCESCEAYQVTRVIDGDTIDTALGRIRIYGADTPEIGERCYQEATDELERLADGKVRLQPGPRATDSFGRRLFYLYTESGDSIDELLVRDGFAVAWTFDGPHRDLLVATEQAAQSQGVGCLWDSAAG